MKNFRFTKRNIRRVIAFVYHKSLIALAFLFSVFNFKKIPVCNFKCKNKNEVNINLFGNIDIKKNNRFFKKELDSIQDIVDLADISFTTIRKKKGINKFCKKIKSRGYTDVFNSNQFVTSKLLKSSEGKCSIGVISCNMYASCNMRKFKILIEVFRLKKCGASFIFAYTNNLNSKSSSVPQKQIKLIKFLVSNGVDYVVNVVPNVRNSGSTYMHKGNIARSVYSIGTFLSDNSSYSIKRVVIKLKLRYVGKKLKVVQESYIPYLYIKNLTFQSLMFEADEIKTLKPSLRSRLSEIEKEMSRLRTYNRMLTVGKINELIGAQLPKDKQYLNDFSVGRLVLYPNVCQPGDVFFFREVYTDPDIPPENVKARLKIVQKRAKVSTYVVSYKPLPIKEPYVQVESVREAHLKACAYNRSKFPVEFIGITGSVGKTSLTDMIYEIVNTSYKSEKSKNNYNIQHKISQEFYDLSSDLEYFVQELGGGRPGGASRISRMILPQIVAITNIGDAHISNFGGDQKKLMLNKLGIADGLKENGLVLLNADDVLLSDVQLDKNLITYAVYNKNADYYAYDISEEYNSTVFNIYDNLTGNSYNAKLNVLGYHNVLNAVCGFALGRYLNIPVEDIVKGISLFSTSGIRQNLNYLCGIHLFMDCYNASSVSMRTSFEVLSKIKINNSNKRIAVIADITGVGDLSNEVHKQIAQNVIELPPDYVIFFGNDVKISYDIISNTDIKCYYTSDREELNKHLASIVNPGDAVMFKGSSKFSLEYTVDTVFGTRFTDKRLIDEREYKRVNSNNVSYNIFKDYATAVKCESISKSVSVKNNVLGKTVVNIASGFKNNIIEDFSMPNTIRHLTLNAFKDCSSLKNIKMSNELRLIDDSCFENCVSLANIELFNGLLHIGNRAFYGCNQLKELYIPESVAQIGEDAFAECPKLTVLCKEGSYAEEYLKENNINYRYI